MSRARGAKILPIAIAFACLFWTRPASAEKLKAKKAAPKVAVSTRAAEGLPVFPPSTAALTVPDVIARLEDLESKMKGLSAHFVQTVRMDSSGSAQIVEGDVDYAKPDRLRVEHEKPERQTVVADGKALWVWRRETNQVIETSLEDWKKSEPLAEGLLDFGGYSGLLKRYDVAIATVSAPGKDGHRRFSLALKPREKAQEFSLTLSMDTRTFFPAEAELKTGGMRVQSLFERLRLNPDFPDGRFRFTPPPGADVFDNFKPPQVK